MTLPGLEATVVASVAAAIGDIRRFSDPQKLVAYFSLNPSVRQSGEGPAYHGRITKQGRGHARGMLLRRHGRLCDRQDLYAPSPSESPRVGGSTSRPSPLHASLQ
ncbi:IS110 family transposase [Mesorhizobium sp. M0041]